jgi:DNA-binding CsgD family transcriptional regulator/biotin operon repressor
MPRRSGRYPWGSGGDPQRHTSFRSHVKELRKQGLSDVEIARGQGMTTTQLRARLSLEKAEERNANMSEAIRLKDKGYSNMEIGRRMGLNESSVRSLLDPVLAERASVTRATANMLKDAVDQKRFVDVGSGVENYMGVSRTKLNTAIAELQQQGYKIHRVNVEQLGMPGQFTIVKVLGAPDTTWSEVVRDVSKIQPVTAYTEDYGRTYHTDLGLKPIQSVKSSRIDINYAETGGSQKDGVIELRRGVKDLDLGKSQYAQVRISVDGTHYLKGMAIYKDDMPDGIDIVFNTNKHNTGNKLDALKALKDEPDNPFGSTIKRQHGALNIVNEEGDWDKWSRTISSQVLSKQTVPLAKKQLGLALKQKQQEYDEIMQLTNPVIKKQLLNSFADDCDASAVHLKAAALPRQASKVILPIPTLKDNEVYAPTFRDGESVVLIRHPHGGTFEIPQLTVNNKSKAAKSVMENAPDAIGIHPNVAKKLSGADFDGDSVIVIPNNQGHIKTSASLKGLQDFDPIEIYRIPKDSKIPPINPKTKQTKMGEVSNLITDMTIKGASTNEIARAVRHSMVVIDSEKHNLDYRQSYIDHGIAALSEKYQGNKRGGASTLISKASSEIRVPDRKLRSVREGGPIDKKTGEKVYTETGITYVDRKGKTVKRTLSSTKMAEAKDAYSLSSGRPIENVYAEYANALKGLANTARKNTLSIKPTPYSPSAKKVYASEVSTLNAKLNIALKNKPLERQAQILANSIVSRKKQASPDMTNEELKKVRNQALAEARTRTGAKKVLVDITDKEWEAIQAGAVSTSKLTQIIQNSNLDRVKQLATPRKTASISATDLNKAKSLLSSGASRAQVAEILGVSVKTLSTAIDKESKERSQ